MKKSRAGAKTKTKTKRVEAKAPKFTQIATATKGDVTRGLKTMLYALDSNGRVWMYAVEYVDGLNRRGWSRLPDLAFGEESSFADED